MTPMSLIDKGVRNSWKWFWLGECSDNGSYETWCKKIDEPGNCYCTVCCKVINYGSGKKALKSHDQQSDHVARFKCVKSSTKLTSSSDSNGSSKKSLQDSCSEIKSVIGLFVSQHCLPFTLAPHLLSLAKKLSHDPVALNSVSLTHTSAKYSTTHGVASYVKASLSEKLKNLFFSLNIDEATTNAGNKILNILVQYFDEEEDKCVVDLLGSKEVNVANADNLLNAVCEVLEEHGLTWEQVISVLMDNCSVMRGKKDGLEAKMRRINSHLLDISGDTVHMVNNAAKKMFEPLEQHFFLIQSLASDIFYDIEDSPKVRCLFRTIQDIILNKKLSILWAIPTRFLQIQSICDRLIALWDVLQLYYSAFLSSKEKSLKTRVQQDIITQYSLGKDDISCIESILLGQQKQVKSDASNERKERIVNALLDNAAKTKFQLQMYRGLLNKFQSFVKVFQTSKPMCHTLHFEMFKLMKSIFSLFVKSESISEFSAKEIHKLDCSDPNLQLKNIHLCVGDYCHSDKMKFMREKNKYPWILDLFKYLCAGYVAAATSLKKLPLTNSTLVQLSFLDPSSQRSSTSVSALLSLAESLPNVVPPQDLGKLDGELRQYTIDDEVTFIEADSDDTDFQIDTKWWSPVFKMRSAGNIRYPYLSNLVKAVLSI